MNFLLNKKLFLCNYTDKIYKNLKMERFIIKYSDLKT